MPGGIICFVSIIYGGKVSDTFIFCESNILDKCEKGDAVMVDKSFQIEELCEKQLVEMIRPLFKWKDEPELPPEDSKENTAIARAQVHIEQEDKKF